MIHGNIPLDQVNPALKEGRILLDSQLSVAKLEQDFKKEFGLSIQVFRKQKEVWIETTRTDSLTLEQQNEKGILASSPAVIAAIGDRYLEDGQY